MGLKSWCPFMVSVGLRFLSLLIYNNFTSPFLLLFHVTDQIENIPQSGFAFFWYDWTHVCILWISCRMIAGSRCLIRFRFKMVLDTYCHISSQGTCFLFAPLLVMLRLSGGVRGSLSVWSIHEPSPDGFYTCWWSLLDPLFHCKMVVFLIRSFILHMC